MTLGGEHGRQTRQPSVLRDISVFVIEVKAEGQGSTNGPHPQYFWLCNSCCRRMTVILDKAKRVHIVSLRVSKISSVVRKEWCDTSFRASGASLERTQPAFPTLAHN